LPIIDLTDTEALPNSSISQIIEKFKKKGFDHLALEDLAIATIESSFPA